MRRPSLAILAIVSCIVILMGMTGVAQAQYTGTGTEGENLTPPEIVGGMSKKLVRGVANVATGWMELPKQTVLTFRDEGAITGIFVGPLKGVGMTVVRTVAGAWEVVAFLVPAPGFYEPTLLPAYVWQDDERRVAP
jgi:putative exosortase-associated protein (TIGR04073 family)